MKHTWNKLMSRSRTEHRKQIALREEMTEVYNDLANKFIAKIVKSDDPESQDVVNFGDDLDALWRLYCKRKNILPQFHVIMKKFVEETIKEYTVIKEELKVKKINE